MSGHRQGIEMNGKPSQFFRKMILIFLLILVGCKNTGRYPTEIEKPTPDSTGITNLKPIETISPTPISEDLLSSDTPSPTSIQTFSPPSSTIIPTLSQTQEIEFILNLLQTNAECKFPCWWGFIPGKTSWESVERFFLPVRKTLRSEEGIGGDVYWERFRIPDNDLGIWINLLVVEDIVKMIVMGAEIYRGEYVIVDDPDFPIQLEHYLLSRILSTHGIPGDVLINIDTNLPGELWPNYDVILFYPSQGIMVKYAGLWKKDKDTYLLCLDKTLISIWFWDPNENMSIIDVYLSAGLEEDKANLISFIEKHQSIEDITSMNNETFYETFKENSSENCLGIPADLWD
jgi:hypothetical protein